jgi:ATP-binding cassette, subfamily F, member 3
MQLDTLIQIRDLSKNYGDKVIFTDAECVITEKLKIGVIGRNGAGKSTLFKMIMGLEESDKGIIEIMPVCKIGYIPQHNPYEVTETVMGFLTRYTGREDWECAKVASQFQLKGDILQKPIGDLSGGYQMRVKLTSTLLFEPNLLLLDEPTNYLDLSTLILLEQFLKTFKGGFLCITHDREFIKKTCTATMEVAHGKITLHPEKLEDYLEFKEEQIALAESVNENIEKKQKQLQTFVNRFGAKASMAKSAQSKLKQIDKLDNKKIGIAHKLAVVRMKIPDVITRGGIGLTMSKMDIGYPDRTVASGINMELEKGKKVAILGDNGQGKSTLLKNMAGILQPLEGIIKWSSGLKVAYYAQHVNLALIDNETAEEYLKRVADDTVKTDELYRMLSNFLFKNEEARKMVGVMSGGEKARLCLAGMFLSRSDVLLLDEPTNHLDFETVEAMGAALGEFSGTVIVVSHDRTFVNLLANEIWEVQNGKVSRVLGSYEDYVWQKEQEASNYIKNNSKEEKLGSQFDAENEVKNPADLTKEQRKRLFDLKKDLEKINRKINNTMVTRTDEEKVKLDEEWLKLTTEIEQYE